MHSFIRQLSVSSREATVLSSGGGNRWRSAPSDGWEVTQPVILHENWQKPLKQIHFHRWLICPFCFGTVTFHVCFYPQNNAFQWNREARNVHMMKTFNRRVCNAQKMNPSPKVHSFSRGLLIDTHTSSLPPSVHCKARLQLKVVCGATLAPQHFSVMMSLPISALWNQCITTQRHWRLDIMKETKF